MTKSKLCFVVSPRSELIYKPLPSDAPTQRQPDITLAKNVLGWEPQVPLEYGLKKTIVYFSEQPKA
jgi:UDP-glucuronate decarboxylase